MTSIKTPAADVDLYVSSMCAKPENDVLRLRHAAALQTESRQQEGLKKAVQEELEWVRSNAKGQQKKGKARLRQYEDLRQQVAPLLSSCSDSVQSVSCHIYRLVRVVMLSHAFSTLHN